MLHLCVHESQPHEKKLHIAQRKLQKTGCAPGQPHRGSCRLLDQDLVLEEGLLDHGAAVEQFVVGHAGDRASQEKMSGSRIGLAAPLPLDGALRTCVVEADGVSWSVPGDGISLANEAPSEARYLFGLPRVC